MAYIKQHCCFFFFHVWPAPELSWKLNLSCLHACQPQSTASLARCRGGGLVASGTLHQIAISSWWKSQPWTSWTVGPWCALCSTPSSHPHQTKQCTTTRRKCMRLRSPENDIWFAHVRIGLSLQSLLILFYNATVCHSSFWCTTDWRTYWTQHLQQRYCWKESYIIQPSKFRKIICCVALLSEIVA